MWTVIIITKGQFLQMSKEILSYLMNDILSNLRRKCYLYTQTDYCIHYDHCCDQRQDHNTMYIAIRDIRIHLYLQKLWNKHGKSGR